MATEIDEYRDLLDAPPTADTLVRGLALVQRLAEVTIELSTAESAAPEIRANGEHTVISAKTWLDQRPEWSACDLPKSTKSKAQVAARDAVATAIALASVADVAQSTSVSRSEQSYSLLMDALVVLVHHAYFYLVPQLKGPQRRYKELLLASMGTFAERLPLADGFRIRALVAQAENHHDNAGELFKAAMAATHSDADEFMSVLQTCWTHLIDRKQFVPALELLLDTYPRVAREDLDEMKQLMLMTMQLSNHKAETVAN